jgi:very-long-chain (3R)-3-hydroxyacyl-CoA dehydratase
MGLSKVYLVSYNVLQFVGWTILMWRLVPHLTQLKAPTEVLYANVGGLLRCVQTAAFLEVAHAAFGKTFKRFSLSEEIGH